ncbi:hypothetical protein ACSBR2_002186 [Camellia fascicularis]
MIQIWTKLHDRAPDLLTSGLLFQILGNNKHGEFGSMKTNNKAIALHTFLFFALYSIILHIYVG